MDTVWKIDNQRERKKNRKKELITLFAKNKMNEWKDKWMLPVVVSLLLRLSLFGFNVFKRERIEKRWIENETQITVTHTKPAYKTHTHTHIPLINYGFWYGGIYQLYLSINNENI